MLTIGLRDFQLTFDYRISDYIHTLYTAGPTQTIDYIAFIDFKCQPGSVGIKDL